MLDLSKEKEGIVTFRTGMKMWSEIYQRPPALFSIRVEDGWYLYYDKTGLATDYHIEADIVAFTPATFAEAAKIAEAEQWSEKKGGIGWNVYVLHPPP